MDFSADDYYPPEWSALPSHIYYFQIIKEGNLLGRIQIKEKQFCLIGRLEDLCDIHIDNPLVSRKHAILQAKSNDHCLYLMDLGSQHGTTVNKVKLPARTYKKLEPFDSVKFGVSSRVYILRCPEYEKMRENEQNERENEFAKLLQEQHKQLSKEELKAKYLDMLQNDPFFAANQGSRTLVGKQKLEEVDEYEGIDWGIDDEKAVYAYKNDSQIQIEPDLLRRLNLDSTQLTKLAQYEEFLRAYQEAEGQYNELTSKEKRQFGLQEKLQAKKQKLERKFMEALQAVQKCENWLRSNIFGQIADTNKKNVMTIRQRQNDTYGDDAFLDRTLQKKEVQLSVKEEIPEAETFWILEAKLKSESEQLEKQKTILNDLLIEKDKGKQIGVNDQQEQDQFDIYMKQAKGEADDSNIEVQKREIASLQSSISDIKNKLKNIVGEQQLNTLIKKFKVEGDKTLHQAFLQKSQEERAILSKKKMESNKNIEDILNLIENAQKNDEQIDEYDESIFKYYKQSPQNQDEQENLDEQEVLSRLRGKRTHYDPNVYQKPSQKVRIGNDHNPVRVESQQPKISEYNQEDVIDLTKHFK